MWHGRFAPGTVLDNRYRIVSLLGRGGMGEVYRADDLRLEQPVALKFLPESLEMDPARLARFHGEVRTARQVSHPNVCRVYDIGSTDGRHFLSMEYVDGEDLASLLRRIGRLPADKGVEVARQLCAGLAAAHDRGVLHRDLKPANIMIDGSGRARLTDFGIAGAASTGEDVRAGTPAYMAPEQLSGREVTVKSDLFALGLVLYEVFTGRRAFDAPTIADLVKQHERGAPPSPSTTVTDLSPAIERTIMRCLESDPALRPALGARRSRRPSRREPARGRARRRGDAVAGDGCCGRHDRCADTAPGVVGRDWLRCLPPAARGDGRPQHRSEPHAAVQEPGGARRSRRADRQPARVSAARSTPCSVSRWTTTTSGTSRRPIRRKIGGSGSRPASRPPSRSGIGRARAS